MRRLLTVILASMALAAPLPLTTTANAATIISVLVVSACATPGSTYTVGTYRVPTMDTTGTLCSQSGGGGGGSNAAAGPTGSAVPADGSYNALNVGGTLRGQTGSNPVGTTYSAHIDLTSVGGVSMSAGAGAVGTSTPRFAIGQDATTMAGSAPGTAGTPATTVGSVQGVSGGTPLPASIADAADVTLGAKADAATCAATNTAMACLRQIDADVKGTGNVQGVAASGATDSDVPLNGGGRAATAAPTAVTDGQKVVNLLGETGKQVILPYSIKETAVRGTTTATDTAAHTIIASAGGSLKNYITGLQCGRTDAGATAITLTMSDAAASVFILPSGGATNIQFAIPLATAAATAFSVTSGTGVSTLYCSAQGYTGL